MVKKLSVNAKYLIAIAFMLLFIFNDLLFDFAFTFNSSDTIAFLFTFLSAIIVFIATGKIKNDEVKKHYYKTSAFIKSNFDNAQVIFSILDIICGLISIFSSYFLLACTFKFVRIIYIPTKIMVVANKEKSLLKPITKFSFFWTSVRIIEKKGGIMANFFKSNKQTLIFGSLISALCGVSVYFALPLFVTLAKWLVIVIAVACFFVVFALVFLVGHDTIESLALRLAKKVLPAEKYEQLINTYNNAVAELKKAEVDAKADKKTKALNAKAESIVAKRLKALKKAEEKKLAMAEKTKQKDAEKAELDKLVEAKLAEKQNTNK